MWTHGDDSIKGALTVHLIADVVVGSHQRHACILHAVNVIFIRHHKYQANPKTHKARRKTLAVRMQTACCVLHQYSDQMTGSSCSLQEVSKISRGCWQNS